MYTVYTKNADVAVLQKLSPFTSAVKKKLADVKPLSKLSAKMDVPKIYKSATRIACTQHPWSDINELRI